MTEDNERTPLDSMYERGREVKRCCDRIGWSMLMLADRIGIKLQGAIAIKNGKRPIADSDLAWLQRLASTVEAVPRPPVVDKIREAEMAESASEPVLIETAELQRAVQEAADVAREAERERVVAALIGAYRAASGESEAVGLGMRGAVSAVLAELGLVERAKAMLAPVRERVPLD